jgi:septal ring-binding cell division protein DamX
MTVLLRKHAVMSVLAIVGLLMLIGPMSALAQSVGSGNQDVSTSAVRSQLLNGGSLQIIDTAQAPCSGQCAVANWQTGACTCPEGYTAIPTARILISVGSGEEGSICGSFLYTCGIPPQ